MKSMFPDQAVATTGLPSTIAWAGTKPKPSERWIERTPSANRKTEAILELVPTKNLIRTAILGF